VKQVHSDDDPDGPHREAIAAQIKPFIDGEIVSGLVVGIYDGGRREIYGFGKGPSGAPPNGRTLFEIGSITKVYTSLMFADSIQRREVALNTAVSDLLPPGVTAPTREKQTISLGHLAVHSSGLPRLPPTIAQHADAPDPYAGYDEDALYRDLVHTELVSPPGSHIVYSNYGAGLLGFLLGKKIGGGYKEALTARVLKPLKTEDTYLTVPPAAQGRRVKGTTTDLVETPYWTFDALAGAGALISSARDQLALVDAELDAAAGGKSPLRPAMRLTQEPQLDVKGENVGLGWQIDGTGRYWHNGGTGGFHSFIGFDPKTKRGVVILASTSVTLVDHLSEVLYKVLDGAPGDPPKLPTADDLKAFAGGYDFAGQAIQIVADGKRLYIEGPGEPRHRLVPIGDNEFWLEELQSIAKFDKAGVVFQIGDRQLVAPRKS
jgi:CubicO group peptidase (beta-lactamase class C family)